MKNMSLVYGRKMEDYVTYFSHRNGWIVEIKMPRSFM